MDMDYNKIVIGGYIEVKNDNKTYASYFKREAINNKRDNNEEFTDFFIGCKSAIGRYGRVIQSQYDKAVMENETGIYFAKSGKFNNVQTKEEIEQSVKAWEIQKQGVIDAGINDNYQCFISANGEVVTRFNAIYVLFYQDIIQLMEGIIQSEFELTNNQMPQPVKQEPPKADAEKPKQFDFNLKSLSLIFQFCIDTAVFSENVSNLDFINAVAFADFKSLFEDNGTKKTKLKYMIFIIHHHIAEKEWYKTAAASIGVTPDACSGANVGDRNDQWKKKADRLKQIK